VQDDWLFLVFLELLRTTIEIYDAEASQCWHPWEYCTIRYVRTWKFQVLKI